MRKVIHLHIKGVGLHRTIADQYFGSISAMYEAHPKELAGISIHTLYRRNWNLEGSYEDERVKIIRGFLQVATKAVNSNMKHSKAHPGFTNVKNHIAAREHISADRAGAILASSTRKASAKAVKKNPRLKRVK